MELSVLIPTMIAFEGAGCPSYLSIRWSNAAHIRQLGDWDVSDRSRPVLRPQFTALEGRCELAYERILPSRGLPGRISNWAVYYFSPLFAANQP